MKNTLLILMLAFVSAGCRNGLNRLVDGAPGPTEPTPAPIIGGLPAPLTSAPEFNVPQPAATKKVVYFGLLPLDGKVQITASANSSVDVFMQERSIGQWFKLKPTYSDAFYYSYDAATGIVLYKGPHLDSKAFCVYQYVAEVQP